MDSIDTTTAQKSLFAIADAIIDNKDMLGRVDGLIGDGDHGINMAKGFRTFSEQYRDNNMSFADLSEALGMILLNEIGGSMGPLYGSLFIEIGEAMRDTDTITTSDMAKMLTIATDTIADIGGAKAGDKTLMDVLVPCQSAMSQAVADGKPLMETLQILKHTAITGRDSTKNMVAKIGRASRLGKRSQGVLDAGACSCCIIWVTMADSILADMV